MKKLFAIFALLGIMCAPAFAQEGKGDMAAGLHLGYTSHLNFGFGVDFKYCVADNWRIVPEFNYFLKHNFLSNIQIAVDANYVMRAEQSKFSFYPIMGLGVGLWRYGVSGYSTTQACFLFNMGLGMQYDINEQWGVNTSFKQQWMSSGYSMGTFFVGAVFKF